MCSYKKVLGWCRRSAPIVVSTNMESFSPVLYLKKPSNLRFHWEPMAELIKPNKVQLSIETECWFIEIHFIQPSIRGVVSRIRRGDFKSEHWEVGEFKVRSGVFFDVQLKNPGSSLKDVVWVTSANQHKALWLLQDAGCSIIIWGKQLRLIRQVLLQEGERIGYNWRNYKNV